MFWNGSMNEEPSAGEREGETPRILPGGGAGRGGAAASGGARIALNGAPLVVHELIIAGWTGRDADAVEAHIRELEALGVPRPKSTPAYYRVAASLLTQASRIQVAGRASSGEAEPVLVAAQEGLWVGVGSDHTDRKLEAHDITLSKQACAKPLAEEFWPFAEVAGHWDSLRLRSFAHEGGRWVLYQEGELAKIRPPQELMAGHAGAAGSLQPGSAMFCGTLAVLGEVRFAEAFKVQLEDPVRQRALSHSYEVAPLPLN